jgi:hypothetical protein
MIKDSGSRREFSTGAVRDIQEGKGRCDLMPIHVIANLLDNLTGGDYVLREIATFAKYGKTLNLYYALTGFAEMAFNGSLETMILETSKHYEEGAKKYGENNWQKGLPVNCYLDSAIRHYLKHRRGDKDEPHDRAVVWNIMCCIWEVDYRRDRTTG